MLRWILLALMAMMLYRLWKKAGRFGTAKTNSQPAFKKPSEMVGCQTCGTYVLKTSAIENNGLFYCGEECRRKQ